MATVSILMAAYEARETILEAVRGVLDQHFQDWELIIAADDGRDYRAFCAANGLRDGRLRATSTGAVAGGPSRARNAALEVANGTFVATLDADDIWAPDKLSTLVPLAASHGLACDNVNVIAESGALVATAFPVATAWRRIDALELIATSVPLFPVARREIAHPGYRDELRFAEDIVFNLDCLGRNGVMIMSGRPLTNYIQRPGSLCNVRDGWKLADRQYARIIEMVVEGAIPMPDHIRDDAVDLLARKKRLNLAYGMARERGEPATFQDFAAQRRETR
jgi:glycosyltransferase involved in cell wall biosynthesis